jgi:hypothetical protein
MLFRRYLDRTEAAFVVLSPAGWTAEGGMFRVNPLAGNGPGQSIEAKIDFALKREPAGHVMIRWLPGVNHVMPAPGVIVQNWNGMPVAPMPTPAAFVTRSVLPQLRPWAKNVQVLGTEPRPDVVAAVRAGPKATSLLSNGVAYHVDASATTVSYEEGGVRYRELLFAAIEGYQMMGAGIWSNALTIVARAPEAEFVSWGPVAKVVVNSFQLNPQWVAAELRGQGQRIKVMEDTNRYLMQVDKEISANRARTMAGIQDQAYLTLTGQERYANPFTGQPELGSNEWKHRWTNAFGEVLYTDDGSWDPNLDSTMNVSGFQRTPVRR